MGYPFVYPIGRDFVTRKVVITPYRKKKKRYDIIIIKMFYLILILILAFSTVSVINSQKTCIQPASGMVSWWSGDGDSEDFYDINHGILYNGASFGSGKVWQAFSFDGVDDYLLAPGEGINDLQQITIEGWVYLN
jgi:hypothetical protein